MSQTLDQPPPVRPPLSWAMCYVLGAITGGAYPYVLQVRAYQTGRAGLMFHAHQSFCWNCAWVTILFFIAVFDFQWFMAGWLNAFYLFPRPVSGTEVIFGLTVVLGVINLSINLWAAWRIRRGWFFTFPIVRWKETLRAVSWMGKGSRDQTLADLTTMLGMTDVPPSTRGAMLTRRGEFLLAADRLDEAIADATEAVQNVGTTPDHKALALWVRAEASRKKGDPDAALSDYAIMASLVDIAPRNKALALCGRAACLFDKGDYKQAAYAYTLALDSPGLAPKDKAQTLDLRALCRQHLGDTAGAMEDHTAALEAKAIS
jgi:hypothetical protein